MPELIISLYSYNASDCIKKSIENLLNNSELDIEIFVVDDGSTDWTVEIVNSIDDNRIRLIKNESNMGRAYCHNLTINSSDSEYICLMECGDFIFLGALKRVIDEFEINDKVGQISAYYIPVQSCMNISRDSYRSLKSEIDKNKTEVINKNQIVLKGIENIGLNIYRRDVFKKVGLFNEKLKYGFEVDMALRMIISFIIKLYPDILYAKQITYKGFLKSKIDNYKKLLSRMRVANNLIFEGKLKIPKLKNRNVYLYYFRSILTDYFNFRIKRLKRINKKKISRLFKNYCELSFEKVYNLAVRIFEIDSDIVFKNSSQVYNNKKIGYVLWHFPVLSQTFIQREISELIKKGINVEVFADGSEDIDLLNKQARSLINITNYINPVDGIEIKKYKKQFFYANPIKYLYLFLYIFFTRYTKFKHYELDNYTFSKAVYLAGRVKERLITHIHAPWANNFAFIALIASRFVNVSFTVHARAYDIHKDKNKFGLKNVLENAEFIITNCEYNESFLKSMLSSKSSSRIHKIYNGINLAKFKLTKIENISKDVFSILSVGRVTEQKGIDYLLKACHILKSEGYNFKCNIIGATAEISYYIKCKVLCRRLGLENHVSFEGGRSFEYIKEQYRHADLVVLPCVISKSGARDIIPNVLIEAMAMKVPVISTNITGIPELVQNGKEGILVPPEDEVSLANAILKLINDKELRIVMGENGRKKVTNRFNININIKKYVELFSN